MERRHLGTTGIEVSVLGLGTVKFGRNQGVKYPSAFEIPEEGHLSSLLSLAKELGINVLDTAPAYGTSEERLGSLLKGQRQDWVIVGKVGEEFEDGKSTYNFSPEHFEKSLARSLKRLNTDYLDVLMIHSNGDDEQILSDELLIEKMLSFKERGLVRAVGASTKTVSGGLKALGLMDVVMATYTPDYLDELMVLDFAREQEKGVILKKALSSGHAQDVEKALEFALSHDGVDSIIIGTINPEHLRQNAQAVNF
jgi:aryl-alcohol dehydrogenase-like predicted oxidoreductase